MMETLSDGRLRLKLLWIKAGGLLPLDTGGKIRSFHIVRELAKRHEVTAFLFYPRLIPDPHENLKQHNIEIIAAPIDLPKRNWRELIHYLRLLSRFHPFSMEKYYSPEVCAAARDVMRSHEFDAIICDFIYPAGLVPWRSGTPVVLFTHNVEAQVWERQYKLTSNPFWRLACYLEYYKMSRAERHYAKQADLLMTVSDRDSLFFRRYISRNVIREIPTGVDADYFTPQWGSEDPNTIIFTGSMDWMPNEDAVLWGVRDILPSIQKEIPDVAFWAVGRKPPASLQNLASRQAALKLTGSVDDIRPYLWSKSVYVVPMRSGSGTRLKIFEAMACGKAVVSTSIGAEGLPVTHGENIILADDPVEFALHVARLLRSPEERGRLGRAARKLVEENFSWAIIASAFEDCLYRADMTGRQAVEA